MLPCGGLFAACDEVSDHGAVVARSPGDGELAWAEAGDGLEQNAGRLVDGGVALREKSDAGTAGDGLEGFVRG